MVSKQLALVVSRLMHMLCIQGPTAGHMVTDAQGSGGSRFAAQQVHQSVFGRTAAVIRVIAAVLQYEC